MNRRDVLKLFGALPLLTIAPGVLALPAIKPRWDRVLVLLELKGGNDGLNTVIPYDDTTYYQLRPRLAVDRGQVIQLNESIGLHPALQSLMSAWNQKELAIVQGVGYDNPNRSHFRSIDIWETASDSEEVLQQGWLANMFDQYKPPAEFAAAGIVVGQGLGPLRGSQVPALIMRNPDQFLKQANRLKQIQSQSMNPALQHVLNVQSELHQAASKMEQRIQAMPVISDDFPRNRIGRDLETAAKLLLSRTQVSVIKVAHGSFDTHSNQPGTHNRLLEQLSESLAVFRSTLIKAGLWDKVLIMTYSEFGRRASENGSRGTDHGTSAPHFLMGGGVKGGLYGRQPSLVDLHNADLRHHVDYRSLYHTVQSQWWGISDGNSTRKYPIIDCIKKKIIT